MKPCDCIANRSANPISNRSLPVLFCHRWRLLFLFLSFFPLAAYSQGYLTQVGDTTFAQPLPLEHGYYDASTGDLHLSIPLGSWSQRGGYSLTASLVYDSRIWTIISNSWQPTNIPSSNGGWRLVTSPASGGRTTYSHHTANCPDGDPGQRYTYNDSFTWTDPFGTVRSFPIYTQTDSTVCNGGSSPSDQEYATDASGYYMVVNNYTQVSGIYMSDGTQVYPTFKDRNGNYFTSDVNGNLVDTVGRTPVKVTTSCNGNASLTCYDVLNSQNTTSRFIVTTETLAVATGFHASGVTEYNGSITTVQSIQLPDNTSYQFTYDYGGSSTFGELAGMTEPTGSIISYDYVTYQDMFGTYNRWLWDRRVGGQLWDYNASVMNGGCPTGFTYCQEVYAIRPDLTKTVYMFGTNAGSAGSYLASTIAYSAAPSSTPLVSSSLTWTTTGQLSSVTTQLVDATAPYPTTTTQYSYFSGNWPTPNSIKEWNSYTGSLPSVPTRITTIGFASGGQYGMALFPSTLTRTDGTGSQTVAKTIVTYDGSTPVSQTGVINHDDTNYGASYTRRGNPTSIATLVNGSTYLTTSVTFDTTGQELSVTDPAGHGTAIAYNDKYYIDNGTTTPSSYSPSGTTHAYPTQITPPIGGTITHGYFFGTGQPALTTDQNGNTWHTDYFDALSRPTLGSTPIGGWQLTQYAASSETQVDIYTGITDTTPSTACGSCTHVRKMLDTLGRLSADSLLSDPDGTTTIGYSYDNNERLYSTTNPYRSTSDPTYGSTSDTYDGANRVVSITHSDGTHGAVYFGALAGSNGGQTTQLCSSSQFGVGYPSLTIDEAGKRAEIWKDGFGRAIEADEPDSSGNLTVNTCYGYDLNDNLISVAPSGTVNRSYSYDLMRRLIQANDPESGSMSYYYTAANGSLCSGDPSALCIRVDARNVTTTYSYDTSNRLTGIAYSDGVTPAISYYYDQTVYNGLSIANGTGRRTGMSDGSGQTAWSFDAVGDLLAERRTIAGVSNTMSYTYDPNGSTASVTYPSGHTISYSYGNAGRATSAIDSSSGINYALQATYAPMGSLATVLHGQTSGFGGITETRGYNSRLETTTSVAQSSTGTALNLDFNYITSSGGNDGSLVGSTNALDNGRNLNFVYDPLNRIYTAQTQATSGPDCWGVLINDDPVGNLTAQTVTQCSGYNFSYAFNSHNQVTSFAYDSSGNLTYDGLRSYAYDGEDRLNSAGEVTYVYDGDGLRVKKSSTPLYWRGLGGSVLEETDLSGNLQNEYIYFAGQKIARRSASGSVYYSFVDELGSIRAITDNLGNRCYDADFQPYGVEVTYTNTCPQNYKFTGFERDPESGLDYAFGRYYDSVVGRFMNPDPYRASMDVSNPQSLDRYSYVFNNPLTYTDPAGFCPPAGRDGKPRPCGGGGAGIEEILDMQLLSTFSSYTVTNGEIMADAGSQWSANPNFNVVNPTLPYDSTWGSMNPTLFDLGPWSFLVSARTSLETAFDSLPNESGSIKTNRLQNAATGTFWKRNWSCVSNVGWPVVASDLNPFSFGPGTPADITSAMSKASLEAVGAWSVQRGLTVPLRSGIIRAGMTNAEVLGRASGWLTVGSVEWAFVHGIIAEHSGGCH